MAEKTLPQFVPAAKAGDVDALTPAGDADPRMKEGILDPRASAADDTRTIGFDIETGTPHGAAAPQAETRARRCAACGSRFTGDARFCPFDGEPLHESDEVEPARDPLIGATIDGRYEVLAVLGEGGMGRVYRVRHRVLEKQLALKVLRLDLARDQDLGVRFTREAKAAAAISHPNVVQITDFGTLSTGQPYFVMELLTGDSLSAILRRGGPLPAARAVRLLTQMIDALAAAHQAGVVHRDLKPDNILVCTGASGEVVKVLDFGLAKVAGQSRLTKAGVVFGTPYYMSPEQASGDAVDERADIYALGVVMYEMFTGRVPFEADTFMGVLTKHMYVAPTPPSVVLGGVAALGALEQITLRCLEKKPDKRFSDMRALGEEIGRVAKFRADGTFTVEPFELRDPREPHRLADELELPTQLEMRVALRRAGIPVPGERTKRPFFVYAALAVLGVLAVALAVTSMRSRGPSLAPAVSERGGVSAGVASGTEGGPHPAPPRTPVAAREPSGRSPVTQVPAGAAPPPPPSASARSRAAPARRPPSTATPWSAPKSSTAKEKVLPTEIVDPWSK